VTSPTIGLDIGGTKILGVLLGADGTTLKEERQASPHGGVDALVATGAAVVEALGTNDEPVGVGVAGLVDVEGRVMYSPNLPNVREAPVRDLLADATKHRVIVDNDANVAAIGEVECGAARGARHAILVTLGTGIGGGIVLDGKIYRGAHGFGAEFGHFTVDLDGPMCACGERGHWEAIASGTALGRMARELVAHGGGGAIVAAAGGGRNAVTGTAVGLAAANGDGDALALLAQYADNVALGLAALANILDPERIVIAGGLVELGQSLFGPMRDAFIRHLEGPQYRPRIEIVPAELGYRAGAVGAAVIARELLSA
jgi:glucokinase